MSARITKRILDFMEEFNNYVREMKIDPSYEQLCNNKLYDERLANVNKEEYNQKIKDLITKHFGIKIDEKYLYTIADIYPEHLDKEKYNYYYSIDPDFYYQLQKGGDAHYALPEGKEVENTLTELSNAYRYPMRAYRNSKNTITISKRDDDNGDMAKQSIWFRFKLNENGVEDICFKTVNEAIYIDDMDIICKCVKKYAKIIDKQIQSGKLKY